MNARTSIQAVPSQVFMITVYSCIILLSETCILFWINIKICNIYLTEGDIGQID